MAKLSEVEGIAATYSRKLGAAGIGSTDALLEAGATKRGRQNLAAKAGVSEKRILEWVNHVDLMRVKGVGSEYSDLLEAAGVDSVPELCQRNPASPASAIAKVNAKKKLVRRVPSQGMVAGWCAAAKKLKRVVKH